MLVQKEQLDEDNGNVEDNAESSDNEYVFKNSVLESLYEEYKELERIRNRLSLHRTLKQN